jgi:hypothetical protein
VDRLINRAGEVALRQPDSPEAAVAGQRAVAAAERLVERDGQLANRRRLARALWRRLSSLALAGRPDEVEQTARQCWALCAALLESTRGDALAYDQVVGDLGLFAGALVPALGSVGRHAEAAEVYETSSAAAAQAAGPSARQAQARLLLFRLFATADEMVGIPFSRSRRRALAEAITSGREVLAVLRAHQGDGVFEVTEVARTLQVLSRLHTVSDQRQEAAASLDDAISVLAPVADQGPRVAALLRGLRAERYGLRNPAPTDDHRAAFLRAARDVEYDAGDLPSTEVGAVDEIARLRLAEASDPARYGPAYGLLMAWRAQLLAAAGQPDVARDLADRSVGRLTLYSDRPQQIQASLVVALAVLQRAATESGHSEQAYRAGQRAAALFAALVARDPTYAQDFAGLV